MSKFKGPSKVCKTCKAPATCLGAYEESENLEYACDECCGHGNEDGHCEPINFKGPSKVCNRCGIEKQLGDYHRSKCKPDKKQPACKQCQKEMGKVNKARSGARAQARIRRLAKPTDPVILRARARARHAVKTGRLVKGPCKVCSTTEEIEMHHYKGYAPEHALDVEWLCHQHHRQLSDAGKNMERGDFETGWRVGKAR